MTTLPTHVSSALLPTPSPAAPALPDWIAVRMRRHYDDRMGKLWGGDHLLHGRTPGPDALFLNSNDYLCLLGERELVRAQARALLGHEHELLMSAVFQHGDTPQSRVEARLAAMMRAEAGLIAQSGWAANVGLIQCIAGPGVPVYIDMAAHASLWEGITAAGAVPVPFRHNDVDHLNRQLERTGPGIIVVDSVYSTTGSVAPLTALVVAAEASGSVIVVDESHSLGTHGPGGATSGGATGAGAPCALSYGVIGQDVCRPCRVCCLQWPVQGFLCRRGSPSHFQFGVAAARTGLVRGRGGFHWCGGGSTRESACHHPLCARRYRRAGLQHQ